MNYLFYMTIAEILYLRQSIQNRTKLHSKGHIFICAQLASTSGYRCLFTLPTTISSDSGQAVLDLDLEQVGFQSSKMDRSLWDLAIEQSNLAKGKYISNDATDKFN